MYKNGGQLNQGLPEVALRSPTQRQPETLENLVRLEELTPIELGNKLSHHRDFFGRIGL
jgi:hypothetical protein